MAGLWKQECLGFKGRLYQYVTVHSGVYPRGEKDVDSPPGFSKSQPPESSEDGAQRYWTVFPENIFAMNWNPMCQWSLGKRHCAVCPV